MAEGGQLSLAPLADLVANQNQGRVSAKDCTYVKLMCKCISLENQAAIRTEFPGLPGARLEPA